MLYKKVDRLAMESPLGPPIANAFDDIFVLFKSSDNLKRFSKLFKFLSC